MVKKTNKKMVSKIMGKTQHKKVSEYSSPRQNDRTTYLQLAGGLGGFPRSRVLDANQQIVVQLAVTDKHSTALVLFILHSFFFPKGHESMYNKASIHSFIRGNIETLTH